LIGSWLAEQLVTLCNKRGYARQEWQKMRERNEALDIRVYARAAAWIPGADRFDERMWRQLEKQARLETMTIATTPTPDKPTPRIAYYSPPARCYARWSQWPSHCGPRIGIGLGNLAVRRLVRRLVQRLQFFDFLLEPHISLRQMRDFLGPHLAFFLPVDAHDLGDVAFDMSLQMRKAAGDLALGEGLVAVVDRLELAAIDRHAFAFQRADPAAQFHELCAGLANG
jgi:hypothetical protein